jgi:alpha-ketoglutarate-dependent taurine dioxygenase
MPETETTPIPPEFAEITLPEPEQRICNGKPFPLVLVPAEGQNKTGDEWGDYIAEKRDVFRQLLIEYGAILFRNFPIDSAELFDKFGKAWGYTFFPYVGGLATRKHITGNVETASEAGPEKTVYWHCETCHQMIYPHYLFFYCHVPPGERGETPICHNNVVYNEILKRDPEFVEKAIKEKVQYIREIPNHEDPESTIGKSWMKTFATTDPKEAERIAVANDNTVEWLPNGYMMTKSHKFDPVMEDKRTGQKLWFNSICGAHFNFGPKNNKYLGRCTFGNGDPMPDESMHTLRDITEGNRAEFTWKKGDVLVVDNKIAAHARRSYEPPRVVYAQLYTTSPSDLVRG